MPKIALISDIHYGPQRGSKLGPEALSLFENFRVWVEETKPALVVDLGDRISEVSPLEDKTLLAEVASWFAELGVPHHHVLGNHDVVNLSMAENQDILKTRVDSHSYDLAGYHLVFWNSGSELDNDKGPCFLEESLDWLERDLKETDLPSVIFTHIPLDSGSMQGNFYFQKIYAHHAHYPADKAEQIREVIERSAKVTLCVNGHTHWNAYHCIDGIHYVTIPSLVETFPSYPEPCAAWASLSIEEDIHIKVYGNLPIEYRLPLKKKGHWLNLDKEYAPKGVQPM